MSMNATPSQIVGCCLRDIGDPEAAARYCRRISYFASMNPWSPVGDAEAYAEASRRLDAIAKERKEEREQVI